MRLSLLALLALALASPAVAGSDHDPGTDGSARSADSVTEIVLMGDVPPPPPHGDTSGEDAVESYLAERQNRSAERSTGRSVKSGALSLGNDSAEELYGPNGTQLVAFDFTTDIAESPDDGRFHATAYLLFANEAGQVVESRDETLVFTGGGMNWNCVSRKTSGSITWSTERVTEAVSLLGVSEEFQMAETHLRDWTAGTSQALGYSVTDISKGLDGRVVVQCLRFKGDPGRRGFDIDSDPLVLTRDGGVFRGESD